MILDAATKSIEVLLTTAQTTTAMPVVVDYSDWTVATSVFAQASLDTQTNGTTPVTIVSGATGIQRTIKSLEITNADSVAKTLTLRLNNSGTFRGKSFTLQVGDILGYTDTEGFYVISIAGVRKGGAGWAADVQNVPAGSIASSNVQAALNELDSEKLALSALGANVASFLATPSSLNLKSAITDETGSGPLVFADSPVLTNGSVAATLADNTATLGIADAKFVKSQIAADTNGHGHSQAVEMTYAASGSTGITVANNSNTDLGTSNFTLIWEGSMPDWTPTVGSGFFTQHLNVDNNIWFYVASDGKLAFYVYLAGAYLIPLSKSTIAAGLVDGTTHQIKVSGIRETATTAGSLTFYIDGIQLGDAVSITAAATTSLTMAASILYISGSNTIRYAGTTKSAYTLNRAITAAEALSIYRNGLAYADKFGSQAELLTNGSFTGSATGWTLGTGWAYGTNNVVATAATGDLSQFVLAPNKRYRVTFTLSGYISGSVKVVYGVVNASGADRSANGTYTEEYATPYNASTTLALRPTTFSGTIDDVSCVQIGATLALEPEGIQPNQWHDSANNLHASYPSAGASLARWKETGLYEWTTAITADTTLTSIVPAGYELEKIVFKNSTTNAVSVRLGTTAGGTDIFGLTALNISTTLGGYKTVLCNQGFSLTAAQTLYLSSTAWSSASLTFTMYLRRIS